MEQLGIIIVLVVFGLIIGSFLTVCIYRIPYGREKGPGELDEVEASRHGDRIVLSSAILASQMESEPPAPYSASMTPSPGGAHDSGFGTAFRSYSSVRWPIAMLCQAFRK